MTTITPELRQAIEQAGDSPVELTDPETSAAYVLLKAEVYHRMQETLEDQRDRQEKDALLERSRRNRLAWLAENPY
jgi:PHD/YefM family antitoxin component YafN of YafNO toxin-antitoxin module